MAGFNPLAAQGNLNRVATHVVLGEYPSLSVNAGFMGKSQAQVTFDGPAVDQIPTATGIVNSPVPYVMGQVVISLLRSQAVANLWLAQWNVEAYVGDVTIYSDSTVLDPIELTNCSIIEMDPGAFDGADPVFKATVKGTYYLNDALWAAITGTAQAV